MNSKVQQLEEVIKRSATAEELAEDGDEPEETIEEQPETPPEEPPASPEQTESDRFFESMESASKPKAKVDIDWVKSTIFHLRQNGCLEVTGQKLAERFKNNYQIQQTLEGMSIKGSVALLLPEHAADFCQWLQKLEEKYPEVKA